MIDDKGTHRARRVGWARARGPTATRVPTPPWTLGSRIMGSRVHRCDTVLDGPMPWTDVLSPAIVIAVVVLLWRDTNGRIAALALTVADLAKTVADVDRRLTTAVSDVDRRLANLEGRITGWQDRQHSAHD